MKKSKVLIQVALILGIIIVINLISSKAFFRLDFTADQRYTLSDATESILENVEDVIDVKVYFTEKLPPQALTLRKDLEDMLAEYETLSGHNLVYKFINPNKDDESEREAQQEGIAPLGMNITERDEVKQIRAYMGLTLESGGKKEVIPFIQPAGMEYTLSTTIKKLVVTDKPKIGILQGHGEASLGALREALQQLSVSYEPEPITLSDTTDVPSYLKALMIINPVDTIPNDHLRKLDHFMQNGGNVYLTYSAVNANLQQQFWGPAPDIGLKQWLKDKGVSIEANLVVDQQCGQIQVQRPNFPIPLPMKFPYIPIITNFGDHPISKGTEQLGFIFANTIEVEHQDSLVKATPLAMTSNLSGVSPAPVYFNVDKQWAEGDFNAPYQPIAMALEGNIMGNTPTKMVLIASGSFGVGEENPQNQRGGIDESVLNFVTNSIDWLADDTGLMALRTKEVKSRPIEKIDDTSRELVKYTNVFLPILILLVYGFIRKQRNQKKRQRWIQGQV
ncbi:MAG: GldG family protein [Flammeovirgaceae bacterium]